MSESVIINVRRQLHWQRRFFSDATTAMLWGFWLWLFRPVFGILASFVGTGLGLQHSLLTALTVVAPTSLETTALALVATSAILLLWNVAAAKLAPGDSSSATQASALPDYASHFGMTSAEVAQLRSNRICVVHHDEQGRIVGIEAARVSLPASAQPQRLAA
jgi:poly-beta-1,6-N-acetyl-D-glucosamine biosynthesis protein PgaD